MISQCGSHKPSMLLNGDPDESVSHLIELVLITSFLGYMAAGLSLFYIQYYNSMFSKVLPWLLSKHTTAM